MKKIIGIILFASLGILGLTTSSHAELVSIDEAQRAAQGWILFIIEQEGSWGGADSASLEDIKEFKRKGQTIGYFGKVHPVGYIVLPLRKEFAPIKSYSTENDLDPDAETGMADIIKGQMEETIKGIENRLGALDKIPSTELQNFLLSSHISNWDKLTDLQGTMTSKALVDKAVKSNYQAEYVLITSHWAQIWPYNSYCPRPDWIDDFIGDTEACDTPALNGHTLAGCVAIAGAQVIRYWNWPPREIVFFVPMGEPYDWPIMPDTLIGADQASDSAVGKLIAKVGDLVDMNYGCGGEDSGSGADTAELENAFDFMYYHQSSGPYSRVFDMSQTIPTVSPTPQEWFDLMKDQLNQNMPLAYSIPGDPGHAVVVDGWRERPEFTDWMEYHINNGHGGFGDGWLAIDESPYTGAGHMMLVNVRPATSLGRTISGTYEKVHPTVPIPRYFNQDAVGSSAVFSEGILLQFLHGVSVTNTSTVGGTFSV